MVWAQLGFAALVIGSLGFSSMQGNNGPHNIFVGRGAGSSIPPGIHHAIGIGDAGPSFGKTGGNIAGGGFSASPLKSYELTVTTSAGARRTQLSAVEWLVLSRIVKRALSDTMASNEMHSEDSFAIIADSHRFSTDINWLEKYVVTRVLGRIMDVRGSIFVVGWNYDPRPLWNISRGENNVAFGTQALSAYKTVKDVVFLRPVTRASNAE